MGREAPEMARGFLRSSSSEPHSAAREVRNSEVCAFRPQFLKVGLLGSIRDASRPFWLLLIRTLHPVKCSLCQFFFSVNFMSRGH
jgi:hypothetical protein